MKKVSFPWMTGKLKTFLYLVSAVTGLGLAACSDETESPAIPDENPLAVNVMTEEVSRGLVHGKFLPDAAEIGVSLYTTDGAAYRTGYENLKYIASGTGDAQSWSTTNIPTLSSIEAKLVAYYPWAENTDYTAVPVETATQTDYMYSGWVSGLSNANNEAYITMDHALTAVRLSLFNDGFSAEAEVTALGIKSEALGTSATLDASTGKLTGIQGLGTEFTVPADFKMAAQAVDTEILMVPDVDKIAGVTTLTATINGKKYAANINFIEGYKQGYIYTYTLALKNTGLSVVKVSVTPWQEGTQDTGDLGVEDKRYTVKINVDDEVFGQPYVHNVYGFTGTIDWGDGTTTTYDQLIGWPAHDYAAKGEYTVTATGQCMALMQAEYQNGVPEEVNKDLSDLMTGRSIQSRASLDNPNPFITEVLHIGKDMGIITVVQAFYGQNKLVKVHNNAFKGLTECLYFDKLFDKCIALQNIPVGLFDKCTEAKSFQGTFYCTGIKAIPAELFNNCTKATDFSECFAYCLALTDIPEGLFEKCTEVTDFGRMFAGSTALTSIPGELFQKNTKVETFNSLFEGCTGLTTIPEGLFDKNTEVTNFAGAFQRTKITEIPAGLFKNNKKAEYFGATFLQCSMLQSIPAGLFDNCTNALGFSSTFAWCTALTGESPYTTINVDGEDKKVHLYERSLYPEHFTAPTSYGGCFSKSTGLTDYANIPAEWKGE